MNGFTLCAHDIVRCVVTVGTVGVVMFVWAGLLVLLARKGA